MVNQELDPRTNQSRSIACCGCTTPGTMADVALPKRSLILYGVPVGTSRTTTTTRLVVVVVLECGTIVHAYASALLLLLCGGDCTVVVVAVVIVRRKIGQGEHPLPFRPLVSCCRCSCTSSGVWSTHHPNNMVITTIESLIQGFPIRVQNNGVVLIHGWYSSPTAPLINVISYLQASGGWCTGSCCGGRSGFHTAGTTNVSLWHWRIRE